MLFSSRGVYGVCVWLWMARNCGFVDRKQRGPSHRAILQTLLLLWWFINAIHFTVSRQRSFHVPPVFCNSRAIKNMFQWRKRNGGGACGSLRSLPASRYCGFIKSFNWFVMSSYVNNVYSFICYTFKLCTIYCTLLFFNNTVC